MVASSGPGVVRGGVWLQYRALVVVIYVLTAPVCGTAVFRTPVRAEGVGRVRTRTAVYGRGVRSQHQPTPARTL